MSRRWITALAATALLALALPTSRAAGQQPDAPVERAVEVRVVEHDEFRWGDAAIGALAGVGLAALCAGVVVTTGRRRGPTS